MPKILIRGYANDENYNATPCLCLDLDAETAQKWMARIAQVKGLKEADDQVYSLDFWEYNGEFFDLYRLEPTGDDADDLQESVDALIEALEGNEDIVTLESGTPLCAHVERKLEATTFDGGARIRTETDMLEVADNGVVRCSYVKHTGIRVESRTFYLDDLAGFAGGLKVKE